jgi:hypothetical protein
MSCYKKILAHAWMAIDFLNRARNGLTLTEAVEKEFDVMLGALQPV